MGNVAEAIDALRRGRPVFLYDFDHREGEVDIVVRADVVDARLLSWIRKVAGGLVCFVTEDWVGRELGIGLMTEWLGKVGLGALLKRPGYGDEPAFSIYVNHINTKTGIRDSDRALTIRRLGDVVSLVVGGKVVEGREIFYREFYAPGHVPILLGRVGRRMGHTELSLLLAKAAGIPPALVIVEMLSDDGGALPRGDAENIAESIGSVLVNGDDLIKFLGP